MVEELIQKELNAENIARELRALMKDESRKAQMKSDYAELRQRLGDTGASERAAEMMIERLWRKTLGIQ